MIQTQIYIDCVDRWCLAEDVNDMLNTDKISDNGIYITIATKSGTMNDINDKIIDVINQPTWSFA